MNYKVSVVDVSGDLKTALTDVLSAIGWSPPLDERLLIKPNMITAKTSEQGVTTDPRIVQLLVEIAKVSGHTPQVGDSPGSAYSGRALEVFEKTGMLDAIKAAGGEFVQFESLPPRLVTMNGKLIDSIGLASQIFEARLINVPKLKTHAQTVMTGAIKNLCFGCIPGAGKSKLHGLGNSPDRMAKVMADVYSAIRPRVELNVMDAIVGMDGNGPTAGRARQIGKILASTDALALDMVSFKMVGLDPKRVPHIRELMARGLGPSNLDEIEVIGELPKTIKYRIPSTIITMLGSFAGTFVPYVSPNVSASPSKCTACGNCAKACPVFCITVDKYARVDMNRCIRCYVCYEVCEFDAIKVSNPLASR